jgi:DNA-binding NtrC family response regulator
MKKRVLFVLAEPAALASLQSMLAPLSDEWEMEFVGKEDEALAILAESTVDVILSGIHLTGMGGLELLAEVKCRAPRVIRIASSGCAHRATIVSALEVAHRFIPMPFTADVLKATIARAGALGARLTNESLRTLIAGIHPCRVFRSSTRNWSPRWVLPRPRPMPRLELSPRTWPWCPSSFKW